MNDQNGHTVDRFLSPRQLAVAIGVSESSLKRWADDGRLAVERTAGGHRRIPLPEAVRFIRRAGLTPARPDLLDLPGVRAVAGSSLDPDSAADRLYAALLEDRSAEARGLIVTLYLNGAGLAWLCDDVIRNALARIGELWEHDAKGVFLEHRATATCARALTELRLLLPPPGDDAPCAIGGAFEGDVYQVPSAMAALVLAEAGYREHDFGADTPVAALMAAVAHYRPQVVWVSFSVPPRSAREAASALASLAEALDDGVLVMGGRGAAGIALPDRGNVHRFESMAELSAFARGAVVGH
jgi:MerR family transcriptional regulator, light-induced transcriptional regulator